MFFTHQAIVDWWYDRIDIYSQCVDLYPETTESFALQDCDLRSISKVSDITASTFALSGLASAVSGSALLIRLIERTWIKTKTKSQPKKRNPRL